MNSRACLLELQIAETKRKNPKDNVLVLPILIRDVSLKGSDLEEKQLLPPDRVPIERWDPRDLGWKHVADAIGKAAEDIAGRRAQIVPEATNLRKADSDFWDRTDVLESLWIQFNDRRRRIQVLTGRAGLGKRWVARRFGWERRPDYKMRSGGSMPGSQSRPKSKWQRLRRTVGSTLPDWTAASNAFVSGWQIQPRGRGC